MESNINTDKKEEKDFNSLIKTLRNEKSLFALEDMIEFVKNNKENMLQNKIITFKQLDDLFFFLNNNKISTSIQIDFFKEFIDLFTSKQFKPEDLGKLNFLSDLFSSKNNFYIQSSLINSMNDLLDKYYNYFFPIEEHEYKENEIVDYLYDEENYYTWTQAKIISINNNQITLHLVLDNEIMVTIKKNSFKIKPKNTFTDDVEINWRNNLKKDILLDCLDIGNNWIKSTIIGRILKNITINYQFYNTNDNKNYGYDNKFNKCFKIYHPQIRTINSESFDIRFFEMYPQTPSQNKVFNEHNMHIPFRGNNYVIPLSEDKKYSMEYILLCNYFMSKIIENNTINENTPIEYFVKSIEIIYLFFKNLSVKFMKDYIPNVLIPSFIKILTNFSLDKTKQFSKVEIDKLFKRIREMMYLAYYDFDIDPIIGPFEVEFGYNCFKISDIFEKKLLGLNILSNSLRSNSKDEISNEKILKVSQFLLNNENGDIIDLIFNDMNIHVELLKKGEEILKSLFNFKLIEQRDIDKIYNYILSNKNNNKDILNSLYSILEENSQQMSFELLSSIINKITSITYDQLTEQDIFLLTNITSKTNNHNSFKNIAKNVLNYLYDYLTNKQNLNVYCYMNTFCSVIQNAKEDIDMTHLYIYFSTKLTEDLYKINSNIFLLIKFLSILLTSIDEKNHNGIADKLSIEIFTKDNGSNKFIGRIIDYCKTTLENENDFNIEIFNTIMIILNVTKYNNLINKSNIIEFFELFVFEIKNRQYREEFLNWINLLQKRNFIDIYPTYDILFDKLKLFCLSIQDKEIIDSTLIKYFYNLFIDFNTINPKIKVKKNPLEFKHFDILWNILINFSMSSLIDIFISNFTLRTLNPEERFKIWDDLVKYAFNNLDINNDISIKGIIDVIMSLIYYSEFYGTAKVISHESETVKKIPINIKIINLFYSNPKSDLELNGKMYNTSTIYDLKKEISKELNIPTILISLNKFMQNEILNKFNGNLLSSFINFNEDINDLSKNYTFRLKKKKNIFEAIIKYPLLDNQNKMILSDRANAVFTEIFYQNSDKGFFDKEILRQYIQTVTNDYNNSERLVSEILYHYDTNKDEKLDFNDFIKYYIDLIHKEENTVWNHIKNLDYRYDLRKCDAAFDEDSGINYIENNKKEYMPRAFLSNNKNYFNIIFEFLNNKNSDISDKANKIIQMLETNKEIYNNILGNNLENIIMENNINIKNYSYQILLSILEKSEKDNEQNNKLWKIDFINNSLHLLINDFINYYDDTFSYCFIQFISVCIKIIYNCITYIINDEKFFTYLKSISNKEIDDENKIIERYDLNFNEEQKNILSKLSLNKILLKIFKIFHDLDHQEKAYIHLIEIVKICVRLITIIMFIDIKDDINIFEEYLKNILSINKGNMNVCLRHLSLSNQLIFNQITEDKKAILGNFEQNARNEILNIESLSKMNNIKFIFTFYENIIVIGLRENKEKLKEILLCFIQILLNINNVPSESIVCGYLSIIKDILSIFKQNNLHIENFDDVQTLKFIIDNYLINDFNKDKEKMTLNFQTISYIRRLYEIIKILISLNPEINIDLFLTDPKIKNIVNYLSNKEEKKNYNPYLESKGSNGYLGIHNLCSICYMISVIQQFYMIPLFRKIILTVETDKTDPDNILFQLQKMFSYLNNSNRKFYSPETFVFSFKDYDGNPTNVNIQCDAQEFLLRFMDQIENLLKNTKYKYLMNSIFGGITCQSLKCKNSNCGNVNKRKEKIYYISLDIKNCKNLKDCLNKYISEENIEDYKCEKCNNKITHVKNVLLEHLPNILIIHLQRITFNYETFQNEKVNSRIEFQRTINIKDYTIDKDNNNINNENYEYNLIGVVVHSGTAQFGHYYSFINSKNKDKNGPWYKFNDMNVSEYIRPDFEQDMFGGNKKHNNLSDDYSASAYMLIYEKIIKNIVFIDVVKEMNNNIINEQNKANEDKKENKDIETYENEKEVNEKINNVDKNGITVFLKEDNEYVKLINYEDAIDYIIKENEKMEIPFINEIKEDNSKFGNDKKIFCQDFNDLLENILIELKNILEKDQSKEDKIESYISIINSFIFTIIVKSYYKSNLDNISNLLIEIYKLSPKILISFIDNYLEPQKEIILNSFLLVQDRELGNSIGNYISKAICESIEKDINSEKSYKILHYFLSIIPVQLSNKWNYMLFYNKFLLNLVKGSEKLKDYFYKNKLISKCIDFILGKESPIYQGDKRTTMKNIKGRFEPLVEIISILYEYSKDKKLSNIDLKCIECDKFYKKVIENNYNNYCLGKLISLQMSKNFNNTEEKIKEFSDNIFKYISIQKINNISTITEATESINLISEILMNNNENEEFKRMKNQILLGIPVLNIDDNNLNIKFNSSIENNKESILQKISTLFTSNRDFVGIAKTFFSLILNSENIYDYLIQLPSLYNFNNNFVEFFINYSENVIDKTKLLKEKKEDENVINAREVIELIKKIREKYNISTDKINDKKMFLIYESCSSINSENENIIVYKSKIEYVSNEIKEKINLNDIEFYINENNNRIRKIKSYDECIFNNKENYKKIIRYFIISKIDCEIKLTYSPFIDYEMKYSLKKNRITEILILDSISKKLEINDNNLIIKDIILEKNNQLPAINDYEEEVNKDVDMDKCIINCPICGESNELNDNSLMKCKFCESNLF